MTQTRFIIGFALASLAFLAGVFGLISITELIRIPVSISERALLILMFCVIACASIAPWFVLKFVTTQRPNVVGYCLGAMVWGAITSGVTKYVFVPYLEIDLTDVALLVAFYFASAGICTIVFAYWKFLPVLKHVMTGLYFIIATSVAVAGYGIYRLYNPPIPEHVWELDDQTKAQSYELSVGELFAMQDAVRTPCNQDLTYFPLTRVLYNGTKELNAIRLSVIDGEVSDRRTFAGLAVKAPDGQWHCNTYVGPDSDMNTYGFSEKENGDVFPSSIYVTVSGHNSSTGLNICVGEDMQACPYLVGASE